MLFRSVVLARARGGHDNITLALLTVPMDAARAERRHASPALVGAAVLLLLAFVMVGMAAAWWLGLWPWK